VRLVTRKLHRAFPELDPFPDDKCLMFLKAANRVRWVVVLRWGIAAGLAVAVTLAGWIGLFPLIDNQIGRMKDARWAVVIDFLVLTGPSLVGLLVLMVVRDSVLRLRIRRVISLRGTCRQCGYSLLGIPIGADNQLTCPECGLSSTADDSMHELVTDPATGKVFPSAHTLDVAGAARRKARRRRVWRWLKRGVLGTVALVLVVAAAIGITLWRWSEQAKVVRIQTAADLQALVEAQWAGGGAGGARAVDAANDWVLVERLIANYEQAETSVLQQPKYAPGGKYFSRTRQYVSLSVLVSESSTEPREQHDLSCEVAWDVVDAMMATPAAAALLDELASTAWAVRPIPPLDPNLPSVFGGWQDAVRVRELAALGPARMQRALAAGDLPEYVRAARGTLTLSHVLRRQAPVTDQYWASAGIHMLYRQIREDAMRYPALTWHDAAAELLRESLDEDRHGEMLIELERLTLRDGVAWAYAEPRRFVRVHTTGIDTALGWGPASELVLRRPQRLNSALQAIDERAAARRKNLLPTDSNVIQEHLSAWTTRIMGRGALSVARERRRSLLIVSAWRAYVATGRLPTEPAAIEREGLKLDGSDKGLMFKFVPWPADQDGPPVMSVHPTGS
jgi:hypothetical protein